jgi:formylglycine-generating enzyme required for sulfatase activity
VTISRPYLISATEVTVGQFRKFTQAARCKTQREREGKPETWQAPGWPPADDLPVVWVNWNDATAFCAWLSAEEKQTYRLPTDAEWEWACRAGKPWNIALAAKVGVAVEKVNHKGTGLNRPIAAGSLPANAWGLHECHGNVAEGTADWSSQLPDSPVEDPKGPRDGVRKIARGGGFLSNLEHCHSDSRGFFLPDQATHSRGFRVVRELPTP